MTFKTKQIKTQTLGEKLKNARESAKMAFWQASKKTKIPANYLKYLEEGNYKNLPADVYVIAYLKKYAAVLNLDKLLSSISSNEALSSKISSQVLPDFRNRKSFRELPVISIVVLPLRM